MRGFISQTIAPARTSAASTWIPGLPHAIAGAASSLAFGWAACVAGLLMASLVSFVVWLPLTALALNHGRPLAPEAKAPSLTPNARLVLFVLWTATAWLAAAVTRQ